MNAYKTVKAAQRKAQEVGGTVIGFAEGYVVAGQTLINSNGSTSFMVWGRHSGLVIDYTNNDAWVLARHTGSLAGLEVQS